MDFLLFAILRLRVHVAWSAYVSTVVMIDMEYVYASMTAHFDAFVARFA